MLKSLFFSLLVAIAFTSLNYYLHVYILKSYNLDVQFDLLNSYVFHFILFLVAASIIEVVFMLSPVQLGFSYLGVIAVKLGAFIIVFNSVLFGDEPADMTTRVSLVVPLMLYIAAETIYCAHKLRKLDSGF